MYKISVFASAARPKIWPDFFMYLISPDIEVVFAGPNEPEHYPRAVNFTFIKTGNIKPAQCYEAARRACTGETVVWAADDMEFLNLILLKAYSYWSAQKNEKLILSLQTKESGYGTKDGNLFNMKEHTFYSPMPETPLMAPVCLMSRRFLEDLGGIDQRYVCGQYENDVVMRAYQQGATVEIFGDESYYVDIDHLKKSIAIGESVDEETFRERPFAKGYSKDREILENSWTTFDPAEAFKRLEAGERPFTLRRVSQVQIDNFEPYPPEISLTESLSNKGHWE